ncbi:DUF92 domain-containing protein [Candidatus Micrarchaeota archaeon]|nr:DUF92 domain-containing protein [Candidatus Micrarchaeota archaeon]
MLMLDKRAIILSVVMGLLLFIFGGSNYLILMLVFLALSVAATRYEEDEKKELGIYEYERGWENVLSNGIIPTLLAVLSPVIGPLPFITSVAAVNSDKFASELGVLGKSHPIYLLSMKRVRPGTSGAMSGLGTLMSLAGAGAIAGAAIIIFGVNPSTALWVMLGGFAGNLMDTLAGIPEEKGIGNKFSSNLLGSLAGGLCGILIS